MRIIIYPRDLLEAQWEKDLRAFEDDCAATPKCLRCGKEMAHHLLHNKLSRYLQIYICRECGDDESIRCYQGTPLPFEHWDAVKNGNIKLDIGPNTALLRPVCDFGHVFQKLKSMPHSSAGRPESLVAYSRSDYNGCRWYTTWFDGPAGHPGKELAREIDDFQNALFDLPEMENIYTMERLRYFAEPAEDKTEYNLYSETEHFQIWIRLIYRQRDYNLYVNFYLK